MSDSAASIKPLPFLDDRADSGNYVACMETYFFSSSRFDDEKVKISHFLLGIQGPESKHWAAIHMKRWQQERKPNFEGTKKITDFDALSALFLAQWEDASVQVAARTKLEILKQGDKTIDEYMLSFYKPAQDSAYNDQTLLYFFGKGMKPGLYSAVINGYKPSEHATLKDFSQCAKDKEEAFNMLQVQRAAWGQMQGKKNTSSNRNTTPQTTTASSPRGQGQSSTSAQQSGTPRLGKLTDADRSKLCQENHCFRCREIGHTSRDCPKNTGSSFTPSVSSPYPRQSSLAPPCSVAACEGHIADTSNSPNVSSLAAQLRALMQGMTEEYREAAFSSVRDMVNGSQDF